MEIEYKLTAEVDGVEVYKTSSHSAEIIEMSLGDAESAVQKEIDELASLRLASSYDS